jgi:hypothetical protein
MFLFFAYEKLNNNKAKQSKRSKKYNKSTFFSPFRGGEEVEKFTDSQKQEDIIKITRIWRDRIPFKNVK